MRFDLVTIFPQIFDGVFENGIIRRARSNGLVDVRLHDLRSFTHDRHRTVDDRPFGGGEGMVLKPEPMAAAIESLDVQPKASRNRSEQSVILLSAQGVPFTQAIARELSECQRVVLLCGRYEGVDERIATLFCDRELSIGDYVLSGGEIAAAVIVDATMRLLPGVLGNASSSEFESFGPADSASAPAEEGGPPRATHHAGGLLDYPHYTRPQEFRGLAVPDVLSGGNHDEIRKWRRQQALEKTLRNRPDLLERAALSREDRRYLDALRTRHQEVDQ